MTRPASQFPPLPEPGSYPDPALLDRPVTFEPVAMEAPGWAVIGAAWAVGLGVIFATWNGSLFG